jgi:hypothetical protein
MPPACCDRLVSDATRNSASQYALCFFDNPADVGAVPTLLGASGGGTHMEQTVPLTRGVQISMLDHASGQDRARCLSQGQ